MDNPSDPNNPNQGGSVNPTQPDLNSLFNGPINNPIPMPAPDPVIAPEPLSTTPPITPFLDQPPASTPEAVQESMSVTPPPMPSSPTVDPAIYTSIPAPPAIPETPSQTETPSQPEIPHTAPFDWGAPPPQPLPQGLYEQPTPSTSPLPAMAEIPPAPPELPPVPPNTPPFEPAPTDLSHLIEPASNSSSETSSYTPPMTQPETLVVPQNSSGEAVIPTLQTANGNNKIPKWIIGLGAGLLITVIGASAYFILGIGQTPQEETTSLPAVQQQSGLQAPPISSPKPQPSPQPETSSTGFGDLTGSTTSSVQATSAAELLKQRQQTK